MQISEADNAPDSNLDDKNPLLTALGERVRMQRARRGMTRKILAKSAEVSERHLANLEYGVGNASILVLDQVAKALHCSLAELLGDVTAQTPEWLMLREMLAPCDETQLKTVRLSLATILGAGYADSMAAHPRKQHQRIALIGLRGAGKSTMGQMLAKDLGFPFVELGREVERLAGSSVAEIQALFGQTAYRRYERRALEESIQQNEQSVIATPGGLVSDPTTFNLLLSNCTTIWLQANPQDHMLRVSNQGDVRPMAASREAMEDLKAILAGRAAFYSKAEFSLDTSAQGIEATFEKLLSIVRGALTLP